MGSLVQRPHYGVVHTMDTINQQNVDAFLADLRELTLEHRIIIWGCGECGSPALNSLDGIQLSFAEGVETEHLQWDDDTKTYSMIGY